MGENLITLSENNISKNVNRIVMEVAKNMVFVTMESTDRRLK